MRTAGPVSPSAPSNPPVILPQQRVEARGVKEKNVVPKKNLRDYDRIFLAVDRLGDEDQEGLEELYQSMSLLIYKDEARFHELFKAYLPNAEKTPLDRSLFLVHALVHFTKDPLPSLGILLETRPTPFPKDAHETTARSVSVMKIFALTEVTKKGEAWKGTELGRKIIPTLVRIAKTEKDLALSREAVKALGQISGNPDPYYREILQTRDPLEHHAFVDLIK